MEFAWVRFYTKKVETCLPISDIGSKQKLPNGLPQIVSFQPKDENDFVPNKWYFAQENRGNSSKDENVKWSRILILYLGATREDINSKKESDRRKKYVNPKCINSESSFEDASRSTSQNNKKVNTERAKNVLRRIENQYEVPEFEDFIDNDNVESSTTSELKNAVVLLKKLGAANSTSVSQPSPPESPSLLDARRRRKSSCESQPRLNRKIPRSNHSVSPTLFESDEELPQSPTQSSGNSSSEQNESPERLIPPQRQSHEKETEAPQDDLSEESAPTHNKVIQSPVQNDIMENQEPSVSGQTANENQRTEFQDASAGQQLSNLNALPKTY